MLQDDSGEGYIKRGQVRCTSSILIVVIVWLSIGDSAWAQRTKPVEPDLSTPLLLRQRLRQRQAQGNASATPTQTTPVSVNGSPSAPTVVPTQSIPTPSPSSTVPAKIPAISSPTNSPVVIPPPPPPPLPSMLEREAPNNPLEAPQDIDRILSTRMTADRWALMYQPLSCLDSSLECVQRLQAESVQNSPIIRELEAKIQEVNSQIELAKSNNKKSIDLSIFEPGLQVFLKQSTVVENGQVRNIGFFDRLGQLFTNPGAILNDLLGAVGIPILRGVYGGSDAQQSRAIQIGDLTIKVAEMERGKVEIANKIRDKIQQLVLEFDTAAREFQAEQAIVRSEVKSFKIYSITYAAGDGDTHTYLNRKEQLERSKLKVFKDWARLRAQIANLKNMVVPREV